MGHDIDLDRRDFQSMNQQRILWEEFPFPRTLEISAVELLYQNVPASACVVSGESGVSKVGNKLPSASRGSHTELGSRCGFWGTL
jgi:hypothetical protein